MGGTFMGSDPPGPDPRFRERRHDSRAETWAHIHEVRRRIQYVIEDLMDRALGHDQSKLAEPELHFFDVVTPQLEGMTYGSDEYKVVLREHRHEFDHHYEANDHHPEHFENGIEDMNLIQMLEMLCDWKAATLRHEDGDILRSIEQNAERFGYGEEVKRLLLNTVPVIE
jgi:hypothetical protein